MRLLWNALVRRGDASHQSEALTMGMRAILERAAGHHARAELARAAQILRDIRRALDERG